MTRDCLRCGQPFESKGTTNRVCDKCNRRNNKITRTEEWATRDGIAERTVRENLPFAIFKEE